MQGQFFSILETDISNVVKYLTAYEELMNSFYQAELKRDTNTEISCEKYPEGVKLNLSFTGRFDEHPLPQFITDEPNSVDFQCQMREDYEYADIRLYDEQKKKSYKKNIKLLRKNLTTCSKTLQ